MLKKIFILSVLVMLVFSFSGCKKAEQAADKTPADYKAQAEQEINKDNMSAELDKLETSIEADAKSAE